MQMPWAAFPMTDENDLEKQALIALEQAFDQPSPQRGNWVQTTFSDQPNLVARVLNLLEAESSLGASLRTGGAREFLEDETRPERAGAYKITGLIGRGGMGAVYTAERDAGDFEHTVAVKIVRPGVLNDALIGRFENERQILASLNHPGIARLFDGGNLHDGSPYIVMELVDGIAISDWVKDKKLSLDDCLTLFAEVCDAVAHAHQNMIVHRDITPNNVLVTQDGAPKLIDFGIAKTQSADISDVAGNSIESLTYTPGFAAPERLAGAPVNTLSDVFSLGRLLANMLDEIDYPEDVGSIIGKATRAEPGERYTTATALSDDIRAYLSGFPVGARNGDAFYRFRKFFNRRKFAVSFGSAAILGLACAFLVTWLQYNRAEFERAIADERFNEAREMANFVIFDFYDELHDIPGTTPVLGDLISRTQTYLDDLSKSTKSDWRLELETIQGYHALGNLQGNPIRHNLGNREAAGELLSISQKRLAELAERKPQQAEILRELGNLGYSRSVYAFIAEDDNQKSLDLAREAVRHFDELSRLGEATVEDEIKRFEVALYTGKPFIWMQESTKAVKIYRQIEADILPWSRAHPDDERVQFTTAAFYSSFTEIVQAYAKEIGAQSLDQDFLDISTKAVEGMNSVLELNDEKQLYRRLSAISKYRRAGLFKQLERYDEAILDYDAAYELANALAEEAPENQSAQILARAILSELMSTLGLSGNHAKAIELAEQVLEPAKNDYLSEPNNPGYWREYFLRLKSVGEVNVTAKRFEQGCSYLETAKSLAMKYDETIGLSETEQATTLDQLLKQAAACRDGSIANLDD